MTYNTVARMQRDAPLLGRCSAAVAGEVSAGNAAGDSSLSAVWSSARAWDLAATPGWSAKWESAEAAGVADPGGSEAAITDADVLARVQQLLELYPLTNLGPIP